MNQVCVDMRARLSSKFRHVHHGINRIDSTHNSGAEVTTSHHNVFPTEKWRTFSNEVSWSLETFGAEYDCLRVEWTEAVSALEMPSWDVLDPSTSQLACGIPYGLFVFPILLDCLLRFFLGMVVHDSGHSERWLDVCWA